MLPAATKCASKTNLEIQINLHQQENVKQTVMPNNLSIHEVYLVVIHNIEQVLLKTSFSAIIITHGPIEMRLCGFGCQVTCTYHYFHPKNVKFSIETFCLFHSLTFVRELCKPFHTLITPSSTRYFFHITGDSFCTYQNTQY